MHLAVRCWQYPKSQPCQRRATRSAKQSTTSPLAKGAPRLGQKIDGEYLKDEQFASAGMQRQKVFAIPFGVQSITVMIGVAAGPIKRAPPAEQVKDTEKNFIECFGAKHCAMAQFMRRGSSEKASNGPVHKQLHHKGQPISLRPKHRHQSPSHRKQAQMSTGLPPAIKFTSMA